MKRWLPLLLVLTAATDPAPPILSAARIKADVRTLSADDFHGRGPTQAGETARSVQYGRARLRIRIEDERGKVPISRLDEAQATRMLGQVGMTGDQLLIARDSLLDWTDDDDMPRPFGAETAYYEPLSIRPPNGFVASVGELRNVRGFTPAIVTAMAPFTTTYVSFSSVFDSRFADPRALAVMDDGGAHGVAAIDRARELAGQRVAIDLGTRADLVARPLTIMVDAVVPDGGHARRRLVVEMTGSIRQPYVVRALE